MAKFDPSKFLYTPPPADALEGPRNKAIKWIDDLIAAHKAKKDFNRAYLDKGDYYDVRLRSGNKLLAQFNVAKDGMADFLTYTREQVASKNVDDWFTADGIEVPATTRKRKPMSEEARAKISAAQKARHAKK